MKKEKVIKIIKISAIAFIGIIITLSITVFLIINSYINKMNLVNDNVDYELIENHTIEEEIHEADEIALEDATEIENSPQEDIDELDEIIRVNTEEINQEVSSEDVYNILLIGSDTREAGGSGRSDAMIIVSINSKTKKIILTSLLRDIYLKIPSRKNNRLNAAYQYGGAELLIDTIEENFQIDIDKYISIDFYAFIDIVDSIDGVTLEVKEKYIPIINFYITEINQHNGVNESDGLLTQAGTYVLNGKQTLGYVRNRYIGTDFERTARQRVVLNTIFDKVKDLNYLKILNLLEKVLPRVTTNLDKKKIISLISSLPTYKSYAIEQWRIPMDGTYSFLTINRMSVIGIDFEKNISELYKKVYEDK
ncbi:MAG: LytR family transcriptional regulator [Anaerolineaceae bacterium]|nr:MAG: LytR family transcriptional regulator [Anaerolineaceae bacterium]